MPQFVASVKVRKNNQLTIPKEVLEETGFKVGETLGYFKDPAYPGAIILSPIEVEVRPRKKAR